MGQDGFLTETDKQILSGEYEGTDTARASARSRLKRRARGSLNELIQVAANPQIDNADVFEPEKIRALLVTLLAGSGGLVGEDTSPEIRATTADPEHRNAVYVATERAQLQVERTTDPAEIYKMYGEKAEQLREFHGIDSEEESDEP